MKKIIFLLMYIISMLCVNSIYAGYTTVDEYRLIFGDGGGFEAVTTFNSHTQQLMPMIQTLPYNETGQTYRAKNINFLSPIIEGETDTSLLYEVSTMAYGDEDNLCVGDTTRTLFYGCPRFLGKLNVATVPAELVNTFITFNITNSPPATVNVQVRKAADNSQANEYLIDLLTDSYWSNEVGIMKFLSFDSIPISSLYQAEQKPDSAYLLIGDSARNFVGIGPGTTNREIDINKYKIIESLNNEAILSKEPIHMGLGDKPIYIGNDNKTNLPIMTLFPVFSDVNSTKAKIAINTNRVIRDLTVIGQFKVEGSLTSQGEFGVLYHASDSEHNNISRNTPPQDVITDCQEFDIDYIAHNFLMLGSVSGDNTVGGRIGIVKTWIELFYKNDYGNYVQYEDAEDSTIQQRTERVIEGSNSQNSVSVTTQLVINLEADNSKIYGNSSASKSVQSSWKACLKVQNEHPDPANFRPKGDQNQLIILGLPGGSLDPNIPDPLPETDVEVFEASELEFVTPDRPLFQKDAMIFRPEDSAGSSERMLAGIATAGDYIIFTDGTKPITLKAPVIDVDVRYKISVLKILDERTENLFNIPKGYTDESANKKDIRLSFIIPYKDSADSNTQNNYMLGPYGMFYNESAEEEQLDTSGTLTEYGIATYGDQLSATGTGSVTGNSELRLSSGLAVGTNSAIKFMNVPAADFSAMNSPETHAQLIMDDTQSSGYFLSNPTAEVAFTGVYQGDIGKMFYLKCAADGSASTHPNVFKKPSEGAHAKTEGVCSSTAQYVMEMHIHGNEMYQEGLDNIGYKFIVLSSLATKTVVRMEGTFLRFDLVKVSDTATLNGNPCGGGNIDCETQTVLFSGDPFPGANTQFTFTNMAMIENVVGIAPNQCQANDCTNDTTYRLTIKIGKSSGDISTNFNDTTFYYSGAMWVLGFPKPLQ